MTEATEPGCFRFSRWYWFLLGVLLLWIYSNRIATNPAVWEEPRRCLIALEMIYRGDYIVPHFLGEPYVKKPPLQNWLLVLMAGNNPTCVGAFPLRLITLASVIGIAFWLWRAGTSSASREASLLPALIFVTFQFAFQFGRVGEVDMLFIFFVTAALVSFELGRRRASPWRQWFVPQVWVAFGVLTKCLAPLFFYPPILWLAWRQRGTYRFAVRPFLCGAALMVAIVGVWLLAYATKAPISGLFGGFGSEMGARVAGIGSWQMLRHLLGYPLFILLPLLPWSLVLLRYKPSMTRFRALLSDPYRRTAAYVFLWGALLFLFVPASRPRYVAPVFPSAAVLLAAYSEQPLKSLRLITPERDLGWRKAFPWLMVTGAWLAAGVCGYIFVAPHLVRQDHYGMFASAVLLGLGVIGLATYVVLRKRCRVSLLLVLGLLYGVTNGFVLDPLRAEGSRPLVTVASEFAANVSADLPVVAMRDVSARLCFYLSRELERPVVNDPPDRGPYYLVERADFLATEKPLAEASGYRMILAGK